MKVSQRIFIFMVLTLLSVGYFLGNRLVLNDFFQIVPVLPFLFMLLLAGYSVFFHVVLHEVGHFIFGKLTGYSLIYFHVPYFHYDAHSKKVSHGKSSSVGLLGQCLMEPTKKKDYKERPYFLYLAGGLIVNFLTGILLYGGSFYFEGQLGLYSFLFSLPPIMLFLGNALPYGMTDGRMIREIGKSTRNKTFYFKQIEMSALLQSGASYSEIPDSYFKEAQNGEAKESFLGEYLTMIYYQSLLEKRDFAKADQVLSEHLENQDYMKSPYGRLIASEKLFCDAIFGRKEQAESTMKTIEKHAALKDHYSQSILTQIAYTLFMEVDIEKARALFPKVEEMDQNNLNKAELELRESLSDWLKGFLQITI